MTEYRFLAAEEYPAAVNLWENVFGVEKPFFTSLLDAGGPTDNVSIAAIEDDDIVSSVHIFIRQIRDRAGVPLKVGGIGSVSTHRDHRKKGHSGRLLGLAIEAMEREGCDWSFLGTGVNDHYARFGWRTVSTLDTWGELRGDVLGEATILSPDDATLAAMAALYEPYTADRPMATVRSEQVWRTAVRHRLDPKSSLIVGAYDGDRLVAYLAAQSPWGKWAFVDAAGDEARFPELFAAGAQLLHERQVNRMFCLLPMTPAISGCFRSVVEQIVAAESRSEMVRPIANRIGWPDLFALYGDPAGRHCLLDAF